MSRINLKGIKIISKRKLPKKITVYDFEVEDAHHYILAQSKIISHNSYFPTREMAGGGGLKYAASGILSLAKSKDRDEKSKEVTGNIIKVMVVKSRFTKEQKRVETLLRFDGGLDRYYGLLPIAEKYGIFKKKPKGYEMPDGSTAYEKNINKNPEKYYTAEVMALLEDACQKEFKFNRGEAGEALEEEVDDIIGTEVEREEDMPQHDNDE